MTSINQLIEQACLKINEFADNASKLPAEELNLQEFHDKIEFLINKSSQVKKYIEIVSKHKTKNANLTKLVRGFGYSIISLGDNCLPRNLLSKFGLKGLKSEGELSFPFDLAIHPPQSVAELIEFNFKQYSEASSYSIEYGHPVNSALKVMFNHERDELFRVDNYAELIARYESRAKNFVNAIEENRVIFILHCSSLNGISELLDLLDKKLINQDNHVIIIYTGKDISAISNAVSQKNYSKFQINVIHATVPDSDYSWFKVDHYTSEKGLAFELNIIEQIERYYVKIVKREVFESEIYSLSKSASEIDSFEYIQKLLYLLDFDILHKIKKDSITEGFNAYLRVCDSLDKSYGIHSNEIKVDVSSLSDFELFNFTFIFQSNTEKYCVDTFRRVFNLDIVLFKRLLCRKEVVISLCRLIEKGIDFEIYPTKLLFLCFALTAHRLKQFEHEVEFLKLVKKLVENGVGEHRHIICLFISKRISLFENETLLPMKKVERIALVISGQLRGYKEALPTLAKAFKSISNLDVYVSTWENVGVTSFSPERLDRIFESNAVDWINGNNAIELARNVYNKLSSSFNVCEQALYQEVKSIFQGCGNININVLKDECYPFCSMSNAEKMFFHNAYWFNSDNEFDWNQYDLIIKVRPDIKFPIGELHFDDLHTDSVIYCEDSNGWIYREWGFGIGDQIMYATPNIMVGLMSIHGENCYSAIAKLLNSTNESYLGHVNCGLYAWANVKDCKTTKVVHNKICTFKKFTLSEVNSEKVSFRS